MATRKGSFRARASSILRSPLSTIHQGQFHDSSRERRPSNQSHSTALNEKQDAFETSHSASSGGLTYAASIGDASAHNRDAQRAVRTVPSWVHTRDEIEDGSLPTTNTAREFNKNLLRRLDETNADETSPQEIAEAKLQSIKQDEAEVDRAGKHFLPPAGAYLAHHNSYPSNKRDRNAPPIRLYDHEREWTPPWAGATSENRISRWKAFADATAYPRLNPNGGRIVTEDWLRENGPDYDRPWLAGNEDGDSENGMAGLFKSGIRRRVWYERLQRTILRSPIVPMVIRMIVFGFSVVALGLACSIHHLTDARQNVLGPTPSTDMAIIVDAVALVYLLYITYDEYSGKPLGLRSARAKMRLIFLDLFFIVFDSANLSIAFVATRDEDCRKGTIDGIDCNIKQDRLFNAILMRQKALASVLLIALIAWLLTFSISIAR